MNGPKDRHCEKPFEKGDMKFALKGMRSKRLEIVFTGTLNPFRVGRASSHGALTHIYAILISVLGEVGLYLMGIEVDGARTA